MLDRIENLTKEAVAALRATAAGDLHRIVLYPGMPGEFGNTAHALNDARGDVLRSAEEERERADAELRLVLDVEDVSRRLSGTAADLGTDAAELSGHADTTARAAHDANATVAGLRRSSQNIASAVDVISRVAAQTRLLALNAAIEAARAGEDGRGFAVVANEVKQLADETAASTEAIRAQVEEATAAATHTAAALEDITGRVEEMTGRIAAISARAGDDGLGSLTRELDTRFAGMRGHRAG